MNDRKQHVVKMAHQLFIDKGFQSTSIQDILDYSGISKGTFYNYFASKNELLMEIFKTSFSKLEKQRDEVLIGQDPSDMEIFIKQIELQLVANRKNKLITLFEEILVSHDDDLKKFIELGKIRNIRWIYQRFIDIFGEKKKPYLLDCAIMFMGMLKENIKFTYFANESHGNISKVVRYTVNRLINIVEGLADSNEQLIHPHVLESWLPDCKKPDQTFRKKLKQQLVIIKNSFHQNHEQLKYMDLLNFIEEELLDSKNPRRFLIKSVLLSLQGYENQERQKQVKELEQLVDDYFEQIEAK